MQTITTLDFVKQHHDLLVSLWNNNDSGLMDLVKRFHYLDPACDLNETPERIIDTLTKSLCKRNALTLVVLGKLYPTTPIEIYAYNYEIQYKCGDLIVQSRDIAHANFNTGKRRVDHQNEESFGFFMNNVLHRHEAPQVTFDALCQQLEWYRQARFITEYDVQVALKVAGSTMTNLRSTFYKLVKDRKEAHGRVFEWVEMYRISLIFFDLLTIVSNTSK